MPGNPRQTGQVAELGGAPTVTGQAQKILERVWSWAWTSSPMTGKTLVLLGVSTADTGEILARVHRLSGGADRCEQAVIVGRATPTWTGVEFGILRFAQGRPRWGPLQCAWTGSRNARRHPRRSRGSPVAFSGRGHAPDGRRTPTAFLARRFSRALALDDPDPLGQAGPRNVRRDRARARAPGRVPRRGRVRRARHGPARRRARGPDGRLRPDPPSPRAVGAAHAGWRGSAQNVAASAVAALRELGAAPGRSRAWIGPSIGSCCYEVGGEVAAQFAGDFVRAGCGGGFRLDLRAVNVAQLEAAGVPPRPSPSTPPARSAAGDRFASYRRDGARAGRMIALIGSRFGTHNRLSPYAGVRSAYRATNFFLPARSK